MSALFLVALSALTSAQEYRADAAVVAWLGDDVLLVDSFVDVPEAGVRVGYLLKSGGPLDERFVIVDRSTGALRSGLLTPNRSEECPTLGEGEDLVTWRGKTIELRGTGPRYWPVLRPVSRVHPYCLFDVTAKTLAPVSTNELQKRLHPTVVKTMTDYAKTHRSEKIGAYTLFDFEDQTRFVASESDRCRLWVIDGGAVEQSLSKAKTDEYCSGSPLVLEWRAANTIVRDTSNAAVWSWEVSPPSREDETRGMQPIPEDTPCYGCGFRQQREEEHSQYIHQLFASAEELEADAAQENPAVVEARVERLKTLAKARERITALLGQSKSASALWRQRAADQAVSQWKAMFRSYLSTPRPTLDATWWSDDQRMLEAVGITTNLATLEAVTWAEVLNNLGFALWSSGEFHQAKGAYLLCEQLVAGAGVQRPVLELNFGDLERDLHDAAEARRHYTAVATSPALTDAQRAHIAQELAKLK